MQWFTRICSGYFNRTTTVVLVLLPLLFAGGFYAYLTLLTTPIPVKSLPIVAKEGNHPTTDTAQIKSDTDGDGLKDWEEIIFHTDPKNPDTDGDGTPDGEEILANRDPLKRGPNDLLAAAHQGAKTSADEKEEPNLTKDLAHIFANQYMLLQLKNPSKLINMDNAELQMAQYAVNKSEKIPVKQYTNADLLISENTSKDATLQYLHALDKSFKDTFGTTAYQESIIKIYLSSLKEKDPDKLVELDKFIALYDAMSKRILALAVPSDFANLHLEYLNTLMKEQEAVKKMRNKETDLVLSAVGMREFILINKGFETIANNYRVSYQNKGISVGD